MGAQAGAATVNVGEANDQVPFQPLLSDTPLGAVKVRVQLLKLVDPVFFSVTVALNPPCQGLSTW